MTATLDRPPVAPAPGRGRRDLRTRTRRTAGRELRADLLSVLCIASVAVAVGLSFATGGLTGLDSPSAVLTEAGVLAGLIATDLVLVMLVLAARIPLVDETFGRDAVMALHRSLGKPVLYLLLAHAALLILGYGLADGLDPIAESLALLTIPDMVLAALGLGLFVAVVVSSLVVVRRRFPYEAWHAVHLLSYAAVLVALPHQLSVGGVFADGTAERVYWIALYALAVGSIGWYRFLLPTFATLRHDLRVGRVVAVAPGVVSIHLTGRGLDRLRLRGGQYGVWRFWSRGTWWHAHPISFSAARGDGTDLRITVRALGKGSAQLAALRRGTRVSFEGPYGVFTSERRTAPHLAIVAAGVGVTPIRSLLEDADLEPGEATVLLRAGSVDEQYLWPEVTALVERSGGRVYGMTGPRARGVDTWMRQDDLERGVTLRTVFPDLATSDLYVCGPQPWTDLVVRDALAAGVPAARVHLERFDW